MRAFAQFMHKQLGLVGETGRTWQTSTQGWTGALHQCKYRAALDRTAHVFHPGHSWQPLPQVWSRVGWHGGPISSGGREGGWHGLSLLQHPPAGFFSSFHFSAITTSATF